MRWFFYFFLESLADTSEPRYLISVTVSLFFLIILEDTLFLSNIEKRIIFSTLFFFQKLHNKKLNESSHLRVSFAKTEMQ